MYKTNLVVNQMYEPGISYGPDQKAVLNADTINAVKAEVTSWPGYAPTPLISLPGRAAESEIAELWCKHEGNRFGIGSFKPTGPTYAMLTVLRGEICKATGVSQVNTKDLFAGKFASITKDVTICAATSGNHGRALAWGAQLFGCRCIIYMNVGVSSVRETVIASFGAEVVRVPGSFDQAVQRSFEDAEENGYFVICDRQRHYPQVPLQIIQGYSLVGDEIVSQLAEKQPPTHVFVPGGSGKLASAVCGRLWECYGGDHPKVITVEPEVSACLQESARTGGVAEVPAASETVMDGLVVGSACFNAWTILGVGAFAFMTVEDKAAVDAMCQAANSASGDQAVVLGDTGSAGWAGFLAVTKDLELRNRLELTADSRVVIVATEGATDPALYESIVGKNPDNV